MNVFFYSVWGENFINNFLKYSLNCLNENLNLISKKNLITSKIEIWTKKNDEKLIKKSDLYKNLKKKININFVHIDQLLTINNVSKYERLAIMQNIFITSHFFKYKYLWFFYPDSIFDNKLVANCIKKLKTQNPDIILLPVPQINQDQIINEFNKSKISNLNIKKLIRNNLHESVKLWNIDDIKNYNIPLSYGKFNDTLVFQNFHIHPLVLKTSGNYKAFLNPVHPSLDEGIPEEYANKKIFIPSDDKFGICGGLLENDFLQKSNFYTQSKKWKNIKDKMSIAISFAINHLNSSHIKFSQNRYFMNMKKTNGIMRKKTKLNNLIKNIIRGYNRNYLLLNNLKKFINKKDIYLNNIPSTLLINEKFRRNFQNQDIIKLNFKIFKKIIKNNLRKNFKIKERIILDNFLTEKIKYSKKIKFYKSFLVTLYKKNLSQ